MYIVNTMNWKRTGIEIHKNIDIKYVWSINIYIMIIIKSYHMLH